MREANEIGSGSGACARQGRGVRRRSVSFRSCSSLGFGLLEENRRAVQRFARLCLLSGPQGARMRRKLSPKGCGTPMVRSGIRWKMREKPVRISDVW